jgi:beta-lysine N6-acetyltransferase
MKEEATVYEVNEKGFTLFIYDDPFNNRIRMDDYYGDLESIIGFAEKHIISKNREKLIFKVRREHLYSFIEKGFMLEAIIPGYFLGADMFFMTKYFHTERMMTEHWLGEDQILSGINKLGVSKGSIPLPEGYQLKKVTNEDACRLAQLYRTVFQIYPTPLHDANYIIKTLEEGTIYYCFYCNGEIVSAASAEVNKMYRNAELTDCATLTSHRKHGLMKILLLKLEEELYRQGIYCSYSIARALSFGMNACLQQLGYTYTGRLKNNVFIYDKLENMNVWVRNLANQPISRP